MNFEMFRLETFKNWPLSVPISKERLAKGGFFYTNLGTTVQCFCCNVQINQWNFGDQVMARHMEVSPHCEFVLDHRLSGNISHAQVNPEKLKDSEVRLLTFVDWPIEGIVKSKDLALAGFYYLNVNDQTKCIYCSGVCMHWGPGDDPKLVHKTVFPHCKVVEAFMELEENRELSFAKWPKKTIVDPHILARAGFFYLNRGDETKCFSCGGVAANWDNGDEPDLEHKKYFPNCKFVKDVITPRITQQASRSESISSAETTDDDITDTEVKPDVPAFPEYSSFEDRLKTFERWSQIIEQKPAELCNAGFFYGGRGDLVKCFQCNGGLQEWHRDDIPWVEHAKWFQNCKYVKENKNQTFIDHCLLRRGAESSISPFWDSNETKEALALEIDPSLVRKAIINQVREHGISFSTSEELVDTALDLGHQAKVADAEMNRLTGSASIELIKENRALKEAKLCKICLDADLAIVFLPCAHFATCDGCSQLVDECPICRRAIQSRLKTFLS